LVGDLDRGHRLATGFERFAIWLSARNFARGADGELLFYWWGSRQGNILPSYTAGQHLRAGIALLASLTVLAWTSSTAGHPILTIIKLMTLPIALLAPWLYARRFPSTEMPFPSDQARRTRQAAMDRFLALALLEVLFGWAIFTAGLVPFDPRRLGLALIVIGLGMLIDGLRRLMRRKPLATEVLSAGSS
jgi:hypothetical protein